jgi:hypothetical protein
MCPWLLRAAVFRRCEEARVLTGTLDSDEIIERVAALEYRQGWPGVLRAGPGWGQAGPAAAGGGGLRHDDPLAVGDG